VAAVDRSERDGRRSGCDRLFGAQGLFTAHITGNLVVVAAHYVTGGFSEIGPILAAPVFVAVLGVVTLASVAVAKAGCVSRRGLLILQAILLAGCLGLAVGFGPITNADRPVAVLVGTLASRRWPLRMRC
jgi:uncharacterized membrane protein YoaK (UPF0700 family)